MPTSKVLVDFSGILKEPYENNITNFLCVHISPKLYSKFIDEYYFNYHGSGVSKKTKDAVVKELLKL